MILRTWVRGVSTVLSRGRPSLSTILPAKKAINRMLFDNNTRLSYKKMIPVLESIYDNLDSPEKIQLPRYVQHNDLMQFKEMLAMVRSSTNSVNKNLARLENELVEQAAELGNNDAITMLAFETIRKPDVNKEDYQYANSLIEELTNIKHPLVFKMGGDLAFEKKFYPQAEQFWKNFLDLESNTILAGQVHAKLGAYYFQYLKPRPNLTLAKMHFEKSIKLGEFDGHILQSYYYLGQLYSTTDPILSRYYLEVAASKGFKESFASLGFLEMNMFKNFSMSMEWFKLGVEASNDVSCLIGLFDSYVGTKELLGARKVLKSLLNLQQKVKKFADTDKVPETFKLDMLTTQSMLQVFFRTRKDSIAQLQ